MIDRDRLINKTAPYDIRLSEKQLNQLDMYAEMLIEWNSRMNLTAITEPEEIETKHFLDCLLAANLITKDDNVADVGTGAGFPGMIMKIFCPEAKITLIDSLDKRLGFLENVADELELSVRCIHGRAEDVGHVDLLRQSFTVTTARAVAPLNVLAEFCLPLTAVGGRMIAMKGRTAEDEIYAASDAIKLLGGIIENEYSFTLPDNSERDIVVIRKVSDTPEKYPRRAPVIKKKPL